ncbi:MAG TPA: dephospho-CoA kinase [Thermoanaerobaculia bacterium]|nr:dephospho-CoA kinase [Thermoanaerobaculia bacterium]
MNRERRVGLRVGLTGGLASGKSTVGTWLSEAGFRVLDADRIVAELYAPGGAGAAAVRRLFGDEYLDAQGGVDHRRLAERVFADGEARKQLERAIHPLVRDRFLELTASDPGIVVLDATLLAEAGYAPDFDFIVTVEAPSGVRLQRAVARGMDEGTARARLLAQGEGAARRDAAHRVLDNCCELPDLRRQVEELIDELQRLANQPPAGG